MIPAITNPARATRNTASTIDHIITNTACNFTKINNPPWGVDTQIVVDYPSKLIESISYYICPSNRRECSRKT